MDRRRFIGRMLAALPAAQAVVGIPSASAAPRRSEVRVFVASAPHERPGGVATYLLDRTSGELRGSGPVLEAETPSYLALHPAGHVLYVTHDPPQPGGEPRPGSISSCLLSPSGALDFAGRRSTHGEGPCHIGIDPAGRFALVTNYRTGNVAVFPVGPDGGLREASAVVQHAGSSAHPVRQQGPHPHSATLDPDGRFAIVADLGTDRMMVYRFDSDRGRMVHHRPPWTSVSPGAGPRHFAFHPNGRFGYVVSELKSEVTVFAFDAGGGVLTPIQTVPMLPPGESGRPNLGAHVALTPDGSLLLASNRGHDSLAIFHVESTTGRLDPKDVVSTGGRTPRHFALTPGGEFVIVANQESDGLVTFAVDSLAGILTPVGEGPDVPAPVCVAILPA